MLTYKKSKPGQLDMLHTFVIIFMVFKLVMRRKNSPLALFLVAWVSAPSLVVLVIASINQAQLPQLGETMFLDLLKLGSFSLET